MGKEESKSPHHKRHNLLVKYRKHKLNHLCSYQRCESAGNSSPSSLLEIYSCFSLRRAAVRRCGESMAIRPNSILVSDFLRPSFVISLRKPICPSTIIRSIISVKINSVYRKAFFISVFFCPFDECRKSGFFVRPLFTDCNSASSIIVITILVRIETPAYHRLPARVQTPLIRS